MTSLAWIHGTSSPCLCISMNSIFKGSGSSRRTLIVGISEKNLFKSMAYEIHKPVLKPCRGGGAHVEQVGFETTCCG